MAIALVIGLFNWLTMAIAKEMNVSSDIRNKLRAKVLSERLKSFTVTLEDGVQVEVRQTTVGQMLNTIEEQDLKKRMVRILIESCYVPETGEKLFDMEDADVLTDMPAGGYYQKLMDAVNERALPKLHEEAKK